MSSRASDRRCLNDARTDVHTMPPTCGGRHQLWVGGIGVLAFNLFRRQLWARCRKGIPSGFHGLRSVSCGCKFTHSAKRGLRGRETRLMDARQLALLARREGFIDPQRSMRVSVQ